MEAGSVERLLATGSHNDKVNQTDETNDGDGNSNEDKGTSWTVEEDVTGISADWCLIDHPEIVKQICDSTVSDLFLNNPRLMSLKNRPKNQIIQLPRAVDVAGHFYCYMCDEIPFPWKGDSSVVPSDDEGGVPICSGILLCENGHSICKPCFQTCDFCTSYIEHEDSFTNPESENNDDVYFQPEEDTKSKEKDFKAEQVYESRQNFESESQDLQTEQVAQLNVDSKSEITCESEEDLESEEGSDSDEYYEYESEEEYDAVLGSIVEWGQMSMCMVPITLNSCVFLTDMIKESEFACQYFYNWCGFRGRGQDLQDHEKQCSYRICPSKSDSSSSLSSISSIDSSYIDELDIEDKDDDDVDILRFRLKDGTDETNDLIAAINPDYEKDSMI